ncbi:MAG: EAL domain-containing protein [Cyanobacteria bacterium P01_D01_bin.73]
MKVRLVSSLSAIAAGGLIILGAWMVNNHERERHLFNGKTNAKDHLSLIRAQIDGAIQQEIQISRGIAYYIMQNPDLSNEGFDDIAQVWLSPRSPGEQRILGQWQKGDGIDQVALLRPGQAPYKSWRMGEESLASGVGGNLEDSVEDSGASTESGDGAGNVADAQGSGLGEAESGNAESEVLEEGAPEATVANAVANLGFEVSSDESLKADLGTLLQTLYQSKAEVRSLPVSELRDRLAIGGIHIRPEGDVIHVQIAIIDGQTRNTSRPELWGVVQTSVSSRRLWQEIAADERDNNSFQTQSSTRYRYLVAREDNATGDRLPLFGDETLLSALDENDYQNRPVIEILQFPRDQWLMALAPDQGWLQGYGRSSLIFGAGGILALAAAIAVYRWTETPVRLQSVVFQQQQKFQEIFEQAAVGIYRTNQKGIIVEVNQRLCQLVGYTEPEIIGLDMMALTHPDDRCTDWPNPWYSGRRLGQMGAQQSTYNFSTRFVRKSGHVQWVNLSISLAYDDNDAVQYAVVVVEDIADRKRAEDSLQASEERWQLALQGNNDGIWDWNVQKNRVFYSARWKTMLGFEDHEIGNRVQEREERIYPDDRDRVLIELQRYLDQDIPTYSCEYRLQSKDGSYKWILDRGQALWDRDGTAIRMVGSCTDIDDRKRAEASLRSSEERFRAIIEQAAVGISQLDRDGYYVKVNEKFCSLLGYHESEILGLNYQDLTFSEDLQQNVDSSQRLWLGDIQSFSMEKRYVRKDKRLQWTNVTVSLVLPSNQEDAYTIAVVEDISARKEAEEKLTYTAFYDALTELPNRNLFVDRLQGTLRKSQRHLDRLYSVLYIDLDRFKVVNDSLGHHAGDDLLVQIGQRLLKCVRCNDMVARLGGDEFAILLDDMESVDDATHIADRIQEHLRQPFRIQEHDFYTSASIGIALSVEPNSQAPYHRWESWMRDADIAMYAAKRKGKSCYEVFNAKMHQHTLTQLRLETDLRQAITKDELELYFQPIVFLQDLTLKGFEALIRWKHPQRGWISPGEFISVAEETDLILHLGQWVLETACDKVKAWCDRGWMKPGMTVSVNVSGRQFTQPDLVETIQSTIIDKQVEPAYLRLEVTETAITDNIESVIDRLARLQLFGIQSCIDDFGTGYSSLSRLQSFPIHALKVDQSFVQHMGDEEGIAVVRTILNLARGLKMSTIAEGIETLDQLNRLKSLGCDYGQGYLFSRPLDSPQAEFLLQGKMEWKGLQSNGTSPTATALTPSASSS